MDMQVKVSAMSLKGGWKRMLAGLPLIMTQAQGPGPHRILARTGRRADRAADSARAVGRCERAPISGRNQPRQLRWFQTGIWFTTKSGDETETHYPLGMFMDRFNRAAEARPAAAARWRQCLHNARSRPARRS